MKALTIKDNLVDGWFEDERGEEQEVIIEVPEAVIASGSDAIEQWVEDYLATLAPKGAQTGFTQTW